MVSGGASTAASLVAIDPSPWLSRNETSVRDRRTPEVVVQRRHPVAPPRIFTLDPLRLEPAVEEIAKKCPIRCGPVDLWTWHCSLNQHIWFAFRVLLCRLVAW